MFQHQLVQQTDSKGVYSVLVSSSGNAYMYIPTTRGIDPKSVDVYVNGKKVSQLFVNDTENGIVYLGHFDKGQRVNVSFGNHGSKKDKGDNVENTPIVVTENNTVYERAYRLMASAGVSKQQVKDAQITFSTDAHFVKGNVVITVPYDSHWEAYVDGKKVTTSRALGELMAVNVSQGAHRIVLRYNVPGLKLGIAMAIVGLALIVGFESISMYRRHRENNHK